MIKLLACFLAIQLTIQTCDKGCLRCANLSATSTEKVCVLCDTSQRYYLKDKTCVVSNAENCSVINPVDGNCAVCNQDYYLDTTTKKCVAVASDKKVTDCVFYDSSQNCTTCASGKFLSQGACVAVTTSVANCRVYQTAVLCMACDVNYYLSSDKKTCTQIPSTANCTSFSQFQCKTCKNTHLLNKNLYFKNRYNYNTTAELAMVYSYILLNKQSTRVLDNGVNVCQKKDVDFCAEFVDFDTCKTCSTGYYLNDKQKCIVYPFDQILNCSVYESESVCAHCEQGSLLKSSNSCVTITEAEKKTGCKTYKTNTSTAQCVECQTTHYLSGTSCVERTKTSVTGCSAYEPAADKCKTCGTNQVLSSDGLLCLNMPSQCATVQSFTSTGTQESLVCTKCNNGYYLDANKACVNGSVENCLTYQTSANTCAVCQNKFFLKSDNTCFAHAEIAQCVNYGKTLQNECTECASGYHDLIVEKYCKPMTEIANCKTYDLTGNDSACTACADGFKLVAGKCESINLDQCITFNTTNSECTHCATGYGLAVKVNNNNTKPGCLAAHEYVSANCASGKLSESSTDFNKITCTACKADAFPYTESDANVQTNVCVNQNRIAQLPTAITALIDNCLAYEDATKCSFCSQGKYLKSDQTACVDNCDSTFTIAMTLGTAIKTVGTVEARITNQRICASTADANFAMKAPNLLQGANIGNLLGVKCKNWVNVMKALYSTTEVNYTNVNPNATNNHAIVENPLDVYNEVDCPAFDAAHEVDGATKSAASDLRTDCDLFFDFDSAATVKYGCVKCQFGKVGNKLTYITPAGTLKSLGVCENMSTCATSTKYRNVNPYWNQLFSCHKCNSTSSIPVLSYTATSKTDPTFTSFVKVNKDTAVNDKTAAATNANDAGSYNANITCLDMSTKAKVKEGLGLASTVADGSIDLLANCGLAVFNTAYGSTGHTTVFNNTKAYAASAGDIETDDTTALLCVSCKPGFKAEYYNNHKNIVRACTEIQHCSTGGLAMNACEQCATGYVHSYDDTNGIEWDKCVQVKANRTGLNNCLAYKLNAANATEGTCKVCKKGYVMNKDNYCEQITVPNCESGRFEDQDTPLNKNVNVRYSTYVYQNGYGCTQCQTGFIAYPLQSLDATARTFCVVSNYVLSTKSTYSPQATNDATKSNFIPNCRYYTNNAGAVTCDTCNDNYVLRADKSECLSATAVPNCLTAANSGNSCTVCKVGYALLTGGSCTLGTIANCDTYYTSTQKSEQQCKTCKNGYYLKTGNKVCSEGHVFNCKVYDDYKEYTCNTCEDSFYLVSGGHYCLKKITDLNCKAATFSSTTANSSGTITCTDSCNNAWEKLITNTPNNDVTQNSTFRKSRCFEINKVGNCKTYSDVFSTSSNTYSFTCTKCEDGYFLEKNGYLCTKRTVQPTNCATYEDDKDKCKTCNTGYYLKVVNGKTDCLANPTGVIKCRTYKFDAGSLACVACKDNYYLSGGKCVEVPTAKRIANCMYYSNETTCSQCSANYYLTNNECKQVTVQNCVKLLNEQSCEVCASTHRVKTENGLNKCEVFTKPNCAKFEQTGDNKCLVCNKNFYPDSNGDCVAVSPIIANCEVAVSNTQCTKCSSDYGLSADGTKCVDKGNYDSNCSEQVMPTNMECNICSGGHYFKDGNCTAFSQNAMSTGCFTVDPANEAECKVCAIGYYMKSDLKCYTMNPTTNPTGNFGFIMKIMIAMFYVLYVQ